LSCNVRTFRAWSARDALELVKRELGPDAVILGTRTVPTGGLGALAGRKRVEITAAPPSLQAPAPRLDPRPASHGRLRPPHYCGGSDERGEPAPDLPAHLYPHYVQLVQNEVAEELAAQLVQQAAARLPDAATTDPPAIREALRAYIAQLIPQGGVTCLGGQAPWPDQGSMKRVALVGPSGGGKTTTLAKLAAHFKLRHQRNVALLSLDMHGLAAHEHLRRYAEVIEVPLHTAQTMAEVKECLRNLEECGHPGRGQGLLDPSPASHGRARPAHYCAGSDVGIDLLLIDTPGVGLREQARFARLATLLRAARTDEIHLVLPASLSPEVQARVAQGFAPLGASRAVLTRLDDAIGFGVVLNVTQRLNLRVSYLTTGQNVPDDLEEACGRRVAELVLAGDD
jgi:flagellar biosynthesis protein FlhF